MNKLNSDELRALFSEVRYWVPQKNERGYIVSWGAAFAGQSHYDKESVFDIALFKEIDPRLPGIMEAAMGNTSAFFDPNSIFGRIVVDTLALWECPCIKIPEDVIIQAGARVFHLAHTFTTISPLNEDYVHVGYTRFSIQHDSNITPYVAYRHATKSTLRKAWVDKTFPDWENRYHLAKSLLLEEEMLLSYVFKGHKGPAGPGAPLSQDITFVP